MNDDINGGNNEGAEQALPRRMKDFNTTIQLLWQGQIPLVRTFWLYYFCAMLGLAVMAGILPGLGRLFMLLQLVWAGFMVRPIMVSAGKYEGPATWAILAKVAAVFIAVGVVANILF